MTHRVREMRAAVLFVSIITLSPIGCQEPAGTDDLLRPTFQVSPETVAPGDSFAVVFTVRNPTSQTVTISSGAGCLFFLRALRDSHQVSVQGLTYFCTAAITAFEVPPRGSLNLVRNGVAAERIGVGVGTPLPPGEYRIQTMMNAALPELQAVLTVQD